MMMMMMLVRKRRIYREEKERVKGRERAYTIPPSFLFPSLTLIDLLSSMMLIMS